MAAGQDWGLAAGCDMPSHTCLDVERISRITRRAGWKEAQHVRGAVLR